MTRVFFAITPQIQICHKIQKAINNLMNKFPAISWENPQKIHLTLAFLGAINDEKLSAVKSVLQNNTRIQDQFKLKIGNLSYFYKKHKDSIIFLDIKDQKKILQNFYGKLKEQLKEKNIFISERLSPHLTIGRLKRKRYPHEIKDTLNKILKEETKPVGDFLVESIDLYESLYRKNLNTAEYRLLQRFPLKFQ